MKKETIRLNSRINKETQWNSVSAAINKTKRHMETFKLQSYTKTDLALLYSPHSETATAIQNLYRWMKQNRPLMSELEAVGYNKYRHSFLKQEVGIIVKYLGEP